MSYTERVRQEALELNEKISRLEHSDSYAEVEAGLLMSQLRAMRGYSSVVSERLELHDGK
jgi:hypothetical protein